MGCQEEDFVNSLSAGGFEGFEGFEAEAGRGGSRVVTIGFNA